jgi:hypothetical protein
MVSILLIYFTIYKRKKICIHIGIIFKCIYTYLVLSCEAEPIFMHDLSLLYALQKEGN